ncbi:MAG: TonB-dependent receptor, partial [Candidatus Eremiobacteraeota bacterium]|nr:TonB-dependent receptor [Candidatus Eremiobacteraeota bacterium]
YGIRLDNFRFIGSDTINSAARTFLYNAYNSQVANGTTIPQQLNVSGQINDYSVWQPRIGLTYTLNPSTVLRASYGRYAQAPNSAFQQYNFLQPNAPTGLKGFANNGIGNTPAHQIVPPQSSNYDFSVEKSFRGDLALKLTPFIRKTQNQIEQFYLDQKTNFVSGVNVGNQTSQGFEFEVDKGDFSRDGLAARLTFAYTDSYIRYNRAANGTSVVDNLNNAIIAYNAFTKAGGGVPCYTTAGAPIASSAACGAGTVANPYYSGRLQGLLDPNANYAPFDLFPAGIGTSYTTYGAPYVGTLILQYKKDRFTISPAFQFVGGQRYGSPINQAGIDPSTCTGVLAGTVANDPRYPNGGFGSPYDATTCTADAVPLPNRSTGLFDSLGGFRMPSQFLAHLQISYQASKNVQLVGTFSNLIYSCFGGSKSSYTVANACTYGAPVLAGIADPIGNAYNPGYALQPQASAVYGPTFRGNPLNFFLEGRIKI